MRVVVVANRCSGFASSSRGELRPVFVLTLTYGFCVRVIAMRGFCGTLVLDDDDVGCVPAPSP